MGRLELRLNFLSFMDWGYLTDLKMAEQRTAPIDSSDLNGDFFEGREDRKVRGMKLYAQQLLAK